MANLKRVFDLSNLQLMLRPTTSVFILEDGQRCDGPGEQSVGIH